MYSTTSKEEKSYKNTQGDWRIINTIRSLKRRRRLWLWCDNTIKVLPCNSRDLLHYSSFIVLFLISFLLNTSSFIFLCSLVNKSVYVSNVLDVYVLVFFYLDLFIFKLHLDRTCDNLILMCLICLYFFLVFFIFLIIYLICFASRLCFKVLFLYVLHVI